MEETVLERDAYRLLLAIGGRVGQWILDRARLNAENRNAQGCGEMRIPVADIRESLRAFLDEGIGELHALGGQTARESSTSLHPR